MAISKTSERSGKKGVYDTVIQNSDKKMKLDTNPHLVNEAQMYRGKN